MRRSETAATTESGSVLFAVQRYCDFAAAPRQDHATVFDCLYRDLVGLGADLNPELLPFRHDLAIDDGKVASRSKGNGANRKRTRRSVRARLIGFGPRDFGDGLPTDWPKRTSATAVHFELGSILRLELWRLRGVRVSGLCHDREK